MRSACIAPCDRCLPRRPVRSAPWARFAARFTDFTVAPETMQLMREMVAHGEADHLVPERWWQELRGGLMENSLRACSRCCARAARSSAAARSGAPVGRAPARRITPRGGHRRAPDDGAGHARAPAGPWTVRLPAGARPGQGHHAAMCCPRHIGQDGAQRRAAPTWRANCAWPWIAERTADVVAREPRPHPPQPGAICRRAGCACWSAAMPSASPRGFGRNICWPANAMHAGGWV